MTLHLRFFIGFLGLFWGLSSPHLAIAAESAPFKPNVNSHGVMLDGYDAVSYFAPEADKKGPIKGDPKFQTNYRGSSYLFSSQANKEEFLKNPQKYAPAFDGWCAYAVASNKSKVDVDPKKFLIQNGKLLLFYNGFFGNTREKWLHNKNITPEAYLQEADHNWPEVAPKEP